MEKQEPLFPIMKPDYQRGGVVEDQRYLNTKVILKGLWNLRDELDDKSVTRRQLFIQISNMITDISV